MLKTDCRALSGSRETSQEATRILHIRDGSGPGQGRGGGDSGGFLKIELMGIPDAWDIRVSKAS